MWTYWCTWGFVPNWVRPFLNHFSAPMAVFCPRRAGREGAGLAPDHTLVPLANCMSTGGSLAEDVCCHAFFR